MEIFWIIFTSVVVIIFLVGAALLCKQYELTSKKVEDGQEQIHKIKEELKKQKSQKRAFQCDRDGIVDRSDLGISYNLPMSKIEYIFPKLEDRSWQIVLNNKQVITLKPKEIEITTEREEI